MVKRFKEKTVLIIEDEADIQNFISRVLELDGYHVLRATDARTGMEIIRENPVALVLLDLRLPGPDGWSVLRAIKSNPEFSGIRVVVLTAIAESMQRRRTLRMGADRYLIKPLSAHSLSKAVAGVMRQGTKKYETVRESAGSLD
jgi:two-component system alkaline phosphatase synthesis response regulator PhoP